MLECSALKLQMSSESCMIQTTIKKSQNYKFVCMAMTAACCPDNYRMGELELQLKTQRFALQFNTDAELFEWNVTLHWA